MQRYCMFNIPFDDGRMAVGFEMRRLQHSGLCRRRGTIRATHSNKMKVKYYFL